jgi:hypothetical protein
VRFLLALTPRDHTDAQCDADCDSVADGVADLHRVAVACTLSDA